MPACLSTKLAFLTALDGPGHLFLSWVSSLIPLTADIVQAGGGVNASLSATRSGFGLL